MGITDNLGLDIITNDGVFDIDRVDANMVIIDEAVGAVESKLVQSNPVGVVNAYAGIATPAGWLLCNGSTFSATTYPVLNTLLGGNILPDLRGEFIRGLDNGRGVDTGRELLTAQADEFKSHTHEVDNSGAGFGGSGSNLIANRTSITSDATGGVETRPRNIAMNYIIKAL